MQPKGEMETWHRSLASYGIAICVVSIISFDASIAFIAQSLTL